MTQTSARARIKLFAEDLLLFEGLQPDEEGVLSPAELKKGLELHRRFLMERVTIRDTDGNQIPSQVTDLVPFEIPEAGIPEEDLMLYQATYELEFRFDTPPEFLTFQQDITDENFILPSEMKMSIHQIGSGNMIAGTLQPGTAVTHRFDWDAPLDPKASDEEYESWLEKQRQDTLGITSYSSVYSFLYVEPGEVRHEILIPLGTLATIIPIERADPAFLEIAEQDAVRTLIQDWLKGGNPVSINGQEVEPEFSSISFYGLNLKDFAQQAEERRVSFSSGRAGIILRYLPARGAVQDVKVGWDTFHSTMRKIRSVVIPWAGDLQRFEFSRFKAAEDNVFQWSAPADALPTTVAAVPRQLPAAPRLTLSWLSCVFAGLTLIVPWFVPRRGLTAVGLVVLAAVCWPVTQISVAHPWQPAPQLSDEEVQQIVEQLQQGTYQTLDAGTEERIYQGLETFVDGELLEQLYLQLREGLAVKEQGGAVARVKQVTFVEGQRSLEKKNGLPWPGFRFHSTWTVAGTVEHWGHVHERQNQFSAVWTVEDCDGTWKFTDLQIDSQQSLSRSTELRKF